MVNATIQKYIQQLGALWHMKPYMMYRYTQCLLQRGWVIQCHLTTICHERLAYKRASIIIQRCVKKAICSPATMHVQKEVYINNNNTTTAHFKPAPYFLQLLLPLHIRLESNDTLCCFWMESAHCSAQWQSLWKHDFMSHTTVAGRRGISSRSLANDTELSYKGKQKGRNCCKEQEKEVRWSESNAEVKKKKKNWKECQEKEGKWVGEKE